MKIKIKNSILENKSKYKTLKFWYFLLFGTFLLTTILLAFIISVINYSLINQQINDFISKNGHMTSEQLKDLIFQQFSNAKKLLNWSSIYLDDKGLINRISFNISEFAMYFFSFFTTISNILVAVWFILTAVTIDKQNKKLKFLSPDSTFTITLLITVTFIIYNFILFPVSIATNKFKLNNWELMQNTIVHIISPLITISAYLFFIDHDQKYFSDKKNLYRVWSISVIVLVLYGVIAIIRGAIAIFGGASADDSASFPYFFVQVFNSNVLGVHGIFIFFATTFIICMITICSSIIYWKIINKRFERNFNLDSKEAQFEELATQVN
ncbi:Pr6Pr family membrane protein [Mycoplasma sp. HU2014]|uniref:Pr6Pr family membrane protein n=1 Tax=Mycoplasma sp. HU2014 TaxID=1664275 RepID=UPI00067CEBED|nr:Pr6Pr family membrane protein [Mycoplasma sp. HU2014]KNG79264.1 membrane protein [Mycoplasma sp. HU2014]